jgi:hypothetical protein
METQLLIKVGKFASPVQLVVWLSSTLVGIVTETQVSILHSHLYFTRTELRFVVPSLQVFHWKLDETDMKPLHMFDRFQSTRGNLPLHYAVSDDSNWGLLSTLRSHSDSGNASFIGAMQLFSVVHKASQIIQGHAGQYYVALM